MKYTLLFCLLGFTASVRLYGACVYSLTGATFAVAGGNGAITLTADPGCAWTVTSDSWIAPTPTSGTGNATINFTVAANVGTARVGYVTVDAQVFRVSQAGDVTAPTVSITSPSNGTEYTTAQTVAVNATASDAGVIDRVEFYDNGGLKGTDFVFPYTYSWTFTSADNGQHDWTAKAFDGAGNNTTSAVVLTTVNIPASNPGQFNWVIDGTGTGSGAASVGKAVTTDATNNVFAVGNFSGILTVSGISVTNVGGQDIFITKHDSSGTVQWVKQIGGTLDDFARAVATDGNGNVIVTGDFKGTVDFGGGPLTSSGGATGSNIYVAKYSPSGAHLWSKRYGASTGNNYGYGVAIDSSGNCFVTGSFYVSIDFGVGTHNSAGSTDIYVVKLLGSNGASVWSRGQGSTTSDYGQAVAVGPNNEVALSGYSFGSINLGGGVLTNTGTSQAYIGKYAGVDGAYLWSNAYSPGAGKAAYSYSVAIDSNDGIAICGSFGGTINFGGTNHVAAVNSAAYMAKYTSAGAYVWSRSFGGADPGGEISYGVDLDAGGGLSVIGIAKGAVDFGNGVQTNGDGTADMFVAKYNGATGAYIWANRITSNNLLGVSGTANDGQGNVLGTGFFLGTVDFGGGPVTNSAYNDAFIVKYSQ